MSTNGTRHFLDLIDIPAQELRSMIDASRAMKERRNSRRGAPEGKPLEGKTMPTDSTKNEGNLSYR